MEDYKFLKVLRAGSSIRQCLYHFFQVQVCGVVVVVAKFLIQTGMSDVADPPQHDSAVWGKDTADPSLPPYP